MIVPCGAAVRTSEESLDSVCRHVPAWPDPANPLLHAHVNDPAVLVHVALAATSHV